MDSAGVIQECTIERRRGAVDGPFFGDPARLEFAGTGRALRLYRSDDRGHLVPTRLASQDNDSPAEPADNGIPPAEEATLNDHFRAAVVVLACRAPTLFEEAVRLSTIFRERAEGRDYRCGAGWHGPMPYVLVADFPWFGLSPALSPELEASVAAAIEAHRLSRHETRIDATGMCVLATRPDTNTIYAVRQTKAGVSVEPYQPGRDAVGSPDQRRWMAYAEKYEQRTVLDAYQDGLSDDILVLSGGADCRVWLHRIDADGVELSCDPANDSALAAVHTHNAPRPHDDPSVTPITDPPSAAASPHETLADDPQRSSALEAVGLAFHNARYLSVDDPDEFLR